jgi:4-amino-4-deoxy-L-arabinose transferase-like glycosyltransferase
MSDFAHYDKPPLVYWVTAISFKMFGQNEWAARLPSLLGALMALAGLGWAAWRLYGNFTAWWAVLFCGTLGQFWVLARMLTPDMLLTGFVTLAIGFWAEERHSNARGIWWWGCALCFTLGWWTKATAALVPLLGLTVAVLATGDRAGLRALRPPWLLLVVLVAGSPWYLSLMHQYPELKNFFFGRELAGRAFGHPDGRRGPFYYHVAFSLVGWLPWWPAALAALVVRRREVFDRLRQRRWQALPAEAWIVIVGLAVFSMMSSKLVTYTLPVAPWAALFCVRVLVSQSADAQRARMIRRSLATAGVCVGFYVVVSLVFPRWESRLGAGSTMREVAAELRPRKAEVLYADRYLPGLEFYFGESVYYVTDKPPRERASDRGDCEALGEPHFFTSAELAAHLQRDAGRNVWFVRYKRKASSPLTRALERGSSQETVRVGDFLLDRVKTTAVADSPGVDPPPTLGK